MNNTPRSRDYQKKVAKMATDASFDLLDMQDEVTQNAEAAKSVLHSLSINAHFKQLNPDAVMTLLSLCIDQIDKMNELSAQMFELTKDCGVMQ